MSVHNHCGIGWRLWFGHNVSHFHHIHLTSSSPAIRFPIPFDFSRSYHKSWIYLDPRSIALTGSLSLSLSSVHPNPLAWIFFPASCPSSIKWSSVILFMKDFLKRCQMLCTMYVCCVCAWCARSLYYMYGFMFICLYPIHIFWCRTEPISNRTAHSTK